MSSICQLQNHTSRPNFSPELHTCPYSRYSTFPLGQGHVFTWEFWFSHPAPLPAVFSMSLDSVHTFDFSPIPNQSTHESPLIFLFIIFSPLGMSHHLCTVTGLPASNLAPSCYFPQTALEVSFSKVYPTMLILWFRLSSGSRFVRREAKVPPVSAWYEASPQLSALFLHCSPIPNSHFNKISSH